MRFSATHREMGRVNEARVTPREISYPRRNRAGFNVFYWQIYYGQFCDYHPAKSNIRPEFETATEMAFPIKLFNALILPAVGLFASISDGWSFAQIWKARRRYASPEYRAEDRCGCRKIYVCRQIRGNSFPFPAKAPAEPGAKPPLKNDNPRDDYSGLFINPNSRPCLSSAAVGPSYS